jgi:P-type conjugative transfer protein VirB9
MKNLGIIISLLLASTTCFSAELPKNSKFDSRIQYVDYNDGEVVVIRSVAGLGSRIVFGKNEKILDVGSGFTQGWEFTDRRNILYIKAKSIPGDKETPSIIPESGTWDTNIMVTTDKRLYDFDLQLLEDKGVGRVSTVEHVAYRLQFRYPAEEKAIIDQQEAKLLAKKKLEESLDAKVAPRNTYYSMQIGENSSNIAPTMAYDDGRFTYLKFPGNRDFPTAFLVAEDKTESLVNSHIDPNEPDTLVLHRVAKEMVIRLGSAVVGIYNKNFDAHGLAPQNGTTVPGVKRVIIKGF